MREGGWCRENNRDGHGGSNGKELGIHSSMVSRGTVPSTKKFYPSFTYLRSGDSTVPIDEMGFERGKTFSRERG